MMGHKQTVKPLSAFEVGQKATFTKTITDADVNMFAGITADYNPVHIDENYAACTRFKKRIAHGVLTLGFVSTTLTLLGTGCIYLNQEVKFKRPVFIGDTITAVAEIVEIDNERRTFKVHTYCQNDKEEIVLDGYAVIMSLPELDTE